MTLISQGLYHDAGLCFAPANDVLTHRLYISTTLAIVSLCFPTIKRTNTPPRTILTLSISACPETLVFFISFTAAGYKCRAHPSNL